MRGRESRAVVLPRVCSELQLGRAATEGDVALEGRERLIPDLSRPFVFFWKFFKDKGVIGEWLASTPVSPLLRFLAALSLVPLPGRSQQLPWRLPGGPAAATPGAERAASLQRGPVGPGEGEPGAVTCWRPFLTQEANFKLGCITGLLCYTPEIDTL